ncbi:MAG: FtsW/RodA/SpoVE family cell cycle protein, partial [Alphaproteobacteria bacterium]
MTELREAVSRAGTTLFGRTDKSILGRWWWSVDRWTLSALGVLIMLGIVIVTAASPSVAERLGLAPFYFVYRHIAFLIPTVLAMIVISTMNRKMLWRIASATLIGAMALTLFAIFFGVEIKGATRWVHIFGFSLQPSEFL